MQSKTVNRANSVRTRLMLGLAAFAAMQMPSAGGAYAQEAQQAPQIRLMEPATGERCQPSPIDPKAFEPFIEAMLKPGGKTQSMADMLKDMPPEMLANLGGLQKAMEAQKKRDWANLCRYEAENAQVLASGMRPRVIFIGDSITENWLRADPAMFDAEVLDRGISGQTTPQILLRFYQDVVALKPSVVHIMAGTNDVAGNTGPATDDSILNNIKGMIDIASAHRIAVVLAAIPPATSAEHPAHRIAGLNRELAAIAKQRRLSFVDYGIVLADGEGGLSSRFGNDGIHPNRDGYAVMRPLTNKAIASALR